MLGTLDRTPPPFFRQGYSALTKLIFFSALSVFLMAADNRLALVEPLRTTIATVLNPAQRALLTPVNAAKESTEYLRGLHEAKQGEESAKAALARHALKAAEAEQLVAENRRLRALLELKPSLNVRASAAEVLYEATDPFSRKLFIDQGQRQGVAAGSPVMSEQGVVGQVTRVYPLSAEVTMLIDRESAIPVINVRTQQRLAAFGGSGPDTPMELRFVNVTADLQVGDVLQTSGVDGVYPPGLPVASIVNIQRPSSGGFTRVVLKPTAALERLQHVLVLEPLSVQMPSRPEPDVERPVRGRAKKTRDAAKAADPAVVPANPASGTPTSAPSGDTREGRAAP